MSLAVYSSSNYAVVRKCYRMKVKMRLSRRDNRTDTKPRRALIEWMVVIIAFWPFLFNFVNTLPGMLQYLKYMPDAMLAVLVVLSLYGGKISIQRKLKVPFVLAILFFFYTLIVYLLQFQTLAYYLWGFRNNFRFIIAFFVFVSVMDDQDAKNWDLWIERLFWVNLIVSLFQFFVLGLWGDHLGGIFGTEKGVNASSIILIFMVLSKSLLRTVQGNEKSWLCILKCASGIFIAAAAELKFMLVIFVVLVLVSVLWSRISWEKIVIVCIAIVILQIGMDYATELFDYENTLTLQNLWELATKKNYSSGMDVNRLSAITTLSERIVKNPIEQIFGLGLGNCDTSSFDACNSTFFQQYGHLHYTWNMSAMLFLETGYVGLIIYMLFLVSCGLAAYMQYKRGVGNTLNNQIAFLMAGLCVALVFYNSSLRTEAAYMIYVVLALPFVDKKKENANAENNAIGTSSAT